MNYYEHHLGDYAEATAHLSFVEDAAYSRMIRKYYSTEKPLPADVKAIQRLIGARSKEERDAVQPILDEFFQLEADGWHNKRCDEVIAAYLAKREKAQASANARWGKSHSARDANASDKQCERNANASETHDGRNALQSPVTNPQYPEQSSSRTQTPSQAPPPTDTRTPDPEPEGMGGMLRAAYPQGAGRVNWLVAMNHAHRCVNEGATWQQLLDGVERYAKYVAAGGVSGPQYVLNPARFFGDVDRPWSQPWTPPVPKAAQPTKSTESVDAWAQVVEAVRHGRYRKPGFTLGDRIDATVRLLGNYVGLSQTDDFGLRQAEKQFHEHFAARAA